MKHIFHCLLIVVSVTQPIDLFSQENNPPVVKIIDPKNKSKHELNSQVSYRIKVSDKEDGESEYGEIASNEVFLEVRYLPDASNVTTLASSDPTGLATMKKSNCFNCHAFNGKLIAPSFYEITKRYPYTTTNIELLTKRIQQGSSGLWGTATMPSHTELSIQQAKEIVNWILKNGEDAHLNYYTGTEGSFKMKGASGVEQTGAFILSATYSDHGAKNNLQQGLTSKDIVVVYLK